MSIRICETVVIGGGPAGSAAAGHLARHGKETVLIERDCSCRKPCGGGIPRIAFDQFNVPLSLAARTVVAFRLVAPSGASVDIPLRDSLFIVDRHRFDTFLRTRAVESGAQLAEGDFMNIERHGKMYHCSVREGGAVRTYAAPYVIAADGVNSRVRITQGIGLPVGASLMTATERFEHQGADRCEFWFSRCDAPDFYSWIFPSADGTTAGTGGRHGDDLLAMLKRFKDRAGLSQKQGTVRMYRIPLWDGALYHRGNILFAGDAAGQVMPLSFEGIYYAMKSGTLAAEAVLMGKAGSYRKLWKEHFGEIFRFAARLHAYFLANDRRAELLVSLHRRQDVQEIAQDIWLFKEHSERPISSYMNIFRKLTR